MTMIKWRIHHKECTASTNLDARSGAPGDVFTADYQTAGRGRLDHKWLSPPETNLMMSVVLGVGGMAPEAASTLPLVVGVASADAIAAFLEGQRALIKWPNDVLVGGRKIAGILCERHGDCVIAGIGINVNKQSFPPEIADRATSMAFFDGFDGTVAEVRDAVLKEIARLYGAWREGGFAAVYPEIMRVDFLKGRAVSVRQTDSDAEPIRGVCGGVMPDGALRVGDASVYAGEAHVEEVG